MTEQGPSAQPAEAQPPIPEEVVFCTQCGLANPLTQDQCQRCSAPLVKDEPQPPVVEQEFPRRPGCVSAYAILTLLGAVLGILLASGVLPSARNEPRSLFSPSLMPRAQASGGSPMFWGLAAAQVLTAVGIWRQKKWGRALVVAASVLAVLSGFRILVTGSSTSIIVAVAGMSAQSLVGYWFYSNTRYFR